MDVYDLEREGETKRALQLLLDLVATDDPWAMLDLAARYGSIESYVHPVEPIEQDIKKSEELAIRAKQILEHRAKAGDGEAMRTLACTYMGHWHPIHEMSEVKAEDWLLKAFEAKCYFAANELASFYEFQDIEKAKYWYRMAEQHNCRVIYSEKLEPAK